MTDSPNDTREKERDALSEWLVRMEESNGPVDEEVVTAIRNRLDAEVNAIGADPADRAEIAAVMPDMDRLRIGPPDN